MYVFMYVCVHVCAQIWIRCPQTGCREFLPFQRLLGGGGSSGWENMSVVWDGWKGTCWEHGAAEVGGGRMPGGGVGAAMCGHVPDAHSFPVNTWVLGTAPRTRTPLPVQHGGLAGNAVRGSRGTAASAVAADLAAEEGRPLSLRPLSQADGAVCGLDGDRDDGAGGHGASDALRSVVFSTELEHGDETMGALIHRDEWAEEGIEAAARGADMATSLAEYMQDPLHPGQLAVQDNLVMEALAACCGDAREIEGVSR